MRITLETLKRINLDCIAEAFAKAGISDPHPGQVSSCVLAAVCYPKNTIPEYLQEFDKDYAYGVMDGFDHDDDDYYTWAAEADINGLKYKLGRADGKAARNIMGVTW